MNSSHKKFDVMGQDRVKNALKLSMEMDRMAHAYLFHGPSGVGKDAMAISLAMGLNCLTRGIEGCGQCPSCSAILRGESPSVFLIMPSPVKLRDEKEGKEEEGDKENEKDTRLRELIREKMLQRIENPYREISYQPEYSGFPVISIKAVRDVRKQRKLKVPAGKTRVIIVSHADRMPHEASNSLLKMLEEPPERTVLILTSSLAGKLLPTVVSRCQCLRFDTLSVEEIEKTLTDGESMDPSRAALLSRMSGGSLGKALRLDETHFEEQREAAVAFLNSSMDEDVFRRFEGIDALAKLPRENVRDILLILQAWLRDIVQVRLENPRIMNIDRQDQLKKFIKEKPDFRAEDSISAVERAIDYIEKNVYIYLICNALNRDLHQCGTS